MKNKVFFLIGLAMGMVFIFDGCKDDECFDETNPDCVNYDPCLVKYPKDFKIETHWYDPENFIEYVPTNDKIFTIPQSMYFFTNFDYDSVLWQVGSDPTIWKRESLPLRFEEEALNSTVTVTAKCFRPVDKKCLGSEDDGIDILTQNYTFRSLEDSPLHGVWRGTNNGEKDSFNVEIERIYKVGQFGDTFYYGARFIGIPRDKQTREDDNNIRLKWFDFVSNSGLHGLLGYIRGRLQDDGTIKIYWRYQSDQQDKRRTFTGKRIK